MNRDDNCQVDFYLLGSAAKSAEKLACKLAMMAWERGHRIAIVTENAAAAAALDQLMWDYPAGRFLPHERCGADEASVAPVCILPSPPSEAAEVLINLSSEPMPEPRLFGRLLEIVPFQPDDRRASRDKYRAYSAMGIEPSTHEIN